MEAQVGDRSTGVLVPVEPGAGAGGRLTSPIHSSRRAGSRRHGPGSVFALDNGTTHRGGPLGEGLLVAEWSLQCPWHSSVFDVRTGEALEPPSPGPVRSYEVSVEGGVVSVAID